MCSKKQFSWIMDNSENKPPLKYNLKVKQLVNLEKVSLKSMYENFEEMEWDDTIMNLIKKYEPQE